MKYLATLLLCAGLMRAGTEEGRILKCLNDFATAVLKNDKATLDKLMADTVVYSHSSGKAETKAEAIAEFEKAKYEQFVYKGQTVQLYGDTAIVRGPAFVINTSNGKRQELSLSILQVWIKSPTKGWQLVARQSTKLP